MNVNTVLFNVINELCFVFLDTHNNKLHDENLRAFCQAFICHA